VASDRIDTETFYTGVLLALAANNAGSFNADGPGFHAAFRAAVDLARTVEMRSQVEVRDIDWMVEDPIYGVMPHADEMLAFGQCARLLSLESPAFVRAQVRYDTERATAALRRLTEHVGWFNRVAETFRAELARASETQEAP
jgi:hypothetical protein